MKNLFKLFFLGGFSILMLCSCNVGRSDVKVDAEILQTLPDSLRQDALYRMFSSVENYNNKVFLFWEPLVNDSEDLIMGLSLSLIVSVSLLLIIYMVLKARSRNLKSELEITEKLLDRIERLHEMNINISDVKSLIPYTFKEQKSPYLFDVTMLAGGLGVYIFGTNVREDFLLGLGLAIAAICALRLIIHIITDYNNKKK